MKLQILQEDLSQGLNLVARAAAIRGQLPILANILFTATKEGLQVCGTNLEIGLRANIGGKVNTEGTTTVPAKTISEFVNSLPSGPLILENTGDSLKVSSLKSSAVFSGIPASEFPVIPNPTHNDSNRSTLTAPQVTKIATEVAFAAATDESRPILTGVQFKSDINGLVVVATDGFRMSQLRISNFQFPISNSLILPARTLLELSRLMQITNEKEVVMQLIPESNQVIFSFEQIDLVSRILEGNFPDVSKIIPTRHTGMITVDREDWIKSLKTAAIFARENNNIVKFKISDSVMDIVAVATSLGENSSQVEVETEGETSDISFNCKFLQDFLASVTGERVSLQMSGSTTAGVFVPEGDENLIHIIMPVRV